MAVAALAGARAHRARSPSASTRRAVRAGGRPGLRRRRGRRRRRRRRADAARRGRRRRRPGTPSRSSAASSPSSAPAARCPSAPTSPGARSARVPRLRRPATSRRDVVAELRLDGGDHDAAPARRRRRPSGGRMAMTALAGVASPSPGPSRARSADRLAALGATVVHVPLIEIAEPPTAAPRCARRWPGSTRSTGSSSRRPTAPAASGRGRGRHPVVRLAAVGPATAAALAAAAGRPVDLVPARRRRPRGCSPSSRRRRPACSRPGRPGPAACSPTGWPRRATHVESVDAYRTVVRRPDADEVDRLRTVDAVVFASGSAATGWVEALGAATPAGRRGDRPGHRRRRPAPRPRTSPTSPRRPTTTPSPSSSPGVRRAPYHGRRCPRRSRSTGRAGCAAPPALRDLVAETSVRTSDLVAPLFVREDVTEPQPIVSLPGVVQHSRESLRKEVAELAAARHPGRRAVRRAGGQGRRRAAAPSIPTASCSSRSPTCAATSATTSC